jgi:hypothetical protein
MVKSIINNNILLKEIRRIVKEEIKKELPNGQINTLYKYLNQLNERIKCVERNKQV